MSQERQYASCYLNKLVRQLGLVDRVQIDRGVRMVRSAWTGGRQIITLGNGGSALTALHFINDWNKSINLSTGKQFRGRTLVDNVGILLTYGNDLSFEEIFVEQLKNIMQPNDLVIAISGSGNSENVLRAVEWANQNGGCTLGLCGYDGGKLKNIAQEVVWVNIADMQICEDVHAVFGHIVMQSLCGYLEKEI